MAREGDKLEKKASYKYNRYRKLTKGWISGNKQIDRSRK